MVSSKSKVKDQTAAILDFSVSKVGQKAMVEAGAYPGTKILADATDVKWPHPLYVQYAADLGKHAQHPFQIENDSAGELAVPFMRDLQSLLDGTAKPEDVAARAQKICEDLRAQTG